jgi:hypothetical protein
VRAGMQAIVARLLMRRAARPQPVSPAQPTADPELPCFGCANSASSVPYPGRPSGERPCCFCERNTELPTWRLETPLNTDIGPFAGYWYDGRKATRLNEHGLQDNYVALDRLMDMTAEPPFDTAGA